MVKGEGINGGKVFGDYPELVLDSALGVGDGVLIPTTAIDEVYAELAMWFGVQKRDLSKLFPNVGNFYSLSNKEPPLGLLQG